MRRTGGTPPKLPEDDLDIARTPLANPDITVADVAEQLGVLPATEYRYCQQHRLRISVAMSVKIVRPANRQLGSKVIDVDSAESDHVTTIATIREEMRFEIGVFHDRVNTLISGEAFLLISFTMSLAYVGSTSSASLFWISPTLSVVGFMLAALAWPGVTTSYKIIVEWNVLFVEVLNAAHAASAVKWRPSVFVRGDRRVQADHRRGMMFFRYVPLIFMVAWVALVGFVIASRRN